MSSNQRQPHLFALALMRQQPSPARLRRIWETTRRFWKDVLQECEHAGALRRVQSRLRIIPQNGNSLNLDRFHAYELVVNRVRVSVVWNGQSFLTTDNLDYLAKPEQLGQPLQNFFQQGSTFDLEEPAGYGAKNKRIGQVIIQSVTPVDHNYLPAISILAEPRTFMALVPADRALAVIQTIRCKYEREMGKVRNRLPIALGAVFFGRRTPLAAALEAGRRMLERPTQGQVWKIVDRTFIPPCHSPERVLLTLQHQSKRIQVQVPADMGDGKTQDVWYPYWCVKGKPTDRSRRFIGPDGEHWVHVADLRTGDCVCFTPSTFDFEYLDTTARRFEVFYDQHGRRPARPSRPHLLEDLDRLDQIWQTFSQLSLSQRRQVLQTIEAARERWFGRDTERQALTDPTFRQLIADTLADAEWPEGHAWKDIPAEQQTQLIAAAVRGELTDLAELHLEIRKEKE